MQNRPRLCFDSGTKKQQGTRGALLLLLRRFVPLVAAVTVAASSCQWFVVASPAAVEVEVKLILAFKSLTQSMTD